MPPRQSLPILSPETLLPSPTPPPLPSRPRSPVRLPRRGTKPAAVQTDDLAP